MDVKDAVRMAKNYVISLPDKGQIGDVGLEEVGFNPDSGNWEITIGFARPWEKSGSQKYPFDGSCNPARYYKLVHINAESGRVEQIIDRTLVDFMRANRIG